MFCSFVEFHVFLLLKLPESESYEYHWTKPTELCHWIADVWTGIEKIWKKCCLKPLQIISSIGLVVPKVLPMPAQYSPVTPLDGSMKIGRAHV